MELIGANQPRRVRIGLNDVGTFCIIEQWPPFTYRGPFPTRIAAEWHALLRAEAEWYAVEIEHVEGKIT